MKLFALTLLSLWLTLMAFVVGDMKPEYKKLMQPCMKQENVTETELRTFFAGGMKPIDATDKIKCHMRCIMEKEGYLKNGTFLEAAMSQSLQEITDPNIQKSLFVCKREKGPNDCETAFLITMCFINNKITWD